MRAQLFTGWRERSRIVSSGLSLIVKKIHPWFVGRRAAGLVGEMVRKVIVDRVTEDQVVLVTDQGEIFQMPRSMVPYVKPGESILLYHERIIGAHMKPHATHIHAGLEQCGS